MLFSNALGSLASLGLSTLGSLASLRKLSTYDKEGTEKADRSPEKKTKVFAPFTILNVSM